MAFATDGDTRSLRLALIGRRGILVVALHSGNAIGLVRPSAEVDQLAAVRAERTPLRLLRPFDALAARGTSYGTGSGGHESSGDAVSLASGRAIKLPL